MERARTAAACWSIVPLACAAIAACGGATTGATTQPIAQDLACLSPLSAHCCEIASAPGAQPCVADWPSARHCASWIARGATIAIYARPCDGLVAARITGAYSVVYAYDAQSGALVAIADDAALDPGSTDFACGAGPGGFELPPECAAAWRLRDGAEGCDPSAGTGTAAAWCAGDAAAR